MLHVDVWWRGHNVAIDAGTFSYSEGGAAEQALTRTAAHNTVTVDGADQMDRYGRFLWFPWIAGRVLQSRGMDYWESGMDMKLGDDIYESFRAYQRALLKEYGSMADEFGFRVLDARRRVEVIQDELRRQIASFLAESDTLAPGPAAVKAD